MTPKQRATLDFIETFYAAHGHPPTQRKIAAEVGGGLGSTNDRLHALAEEGFLRRTPHGRYLPASAVHPDLSRADTQALRNELAKREAQ